MIWGYARTSTPDITTKNGKQDIQRQVKELKEMGATDETIFLEAGESGANEDRKELKKLLSLVKSGDTIVTTEVSRITRSTKQLCFILEFAQKVGIKLIFGTFEVNLINGVCDPMTEGMVKMMGVFAELERKMICQRVKSGMANAKIKGVTIGRKKTRYEDIPASFFHYLPLFQQGIINKTELSTLANISYPSVYKYLDIVNNQQKTQSS